jgi:hypothetical protein
VVQVGATQEKVLNKEKANKRFTVALTPKLKKLLTQAIADRNAKSGIQITQSQFVQEMVEEWFVLRGYRLSD